jgi:hypothetical protein
MVAGLKYFLNENGDSVAGKKIVVIIPTRFELVGKVFFRYPAHSPTPSKPPF